MSMLIDLLDIPKGFTLLTGTPGAGKSTFTCKSQLYQLLDRGENCLSVVTEQAPGTILRYMGQLDTRFAEKGRNPRLGFIDAYRRTVGLKGGEGLEASCSDPTSISLAISDAFKKSERDDILLTFDSLTPLYLLNGSSTTIRFVQTVLARYAAEGFRVLATIDEGVAKPEDGAAIMSIATGILRVKRDPGRSSIDVLKHHNVKVPSIEFPQGQEVWPLRCRLDLAQNHEAYRTHYTDVPGIKCRSNMPDYVHLLWLQLAFWGGMLWDPKRFPRLVYEVTRDMQIHCMKVGMKIRPWHMRLLMSIFLKFIVGDVGRPKSASRFLKLAGYAELQKLGLVTIEFLPDKSKYGEHRSRHTEYAVSWAFPNVGRRLCIHSAAGLSAVYTGLDRSGSDWNVYETQCVGMGSEHCEMVAVKGRPAELEEYIAGMDYSEIEPAIALLMRRAASLLMEDRDEMVRPNLSTDVHLSVFQDLTSVPALSNERYMLAMRLSGVHTARLLAKELLNRGVDRKDASKYLVKFLNTVKAGNVVLADTIRINDCAEAAGIRIAEHACFFTTGFLNGFLEAVEDRRVTKVKCIAAGDSVCEWTY